MRPLFLLSLFACAEPPSGSFAPPVHIDVGDAVIGHTLTITVEGVPDGARLEAIVGARQTSGCGVQIARQCSEIASPSVLANATVANGQARLILPIPNQVPEGAPLQVRVAGRVGSARAISPIFVRTALAADPDCDPETFFTDALWPDLLQGDCTNCHVSGALAGSTRFVLDPGDPATSFAAASWAANATDTNVDGSLIELKPTNQVAHGGGTRVALGSSQHDLLLEFLTHFEGLDCEPAAQVPVTPYYDQIGFIEPERLLQRVAFTLGNRLPTDTERVAVQAGGLTAFEPILRDMLDEQPFYDRVKEGFGDILLTERATHPSTPGSVLSWGWFPSRQWYEVGTSSWEDYWHLLEPYDRGMAFEPVEFIQHVLANDRPFTEIVTGDYMVVSPYSARAYDLQSGFTMYDNVVAQFDDPNDPTEFVQTRLPEPTYTDGTGLGSTTGFYPHAGILSTPHYTRRHQSTDTNRNRHRARQVYKHFLGVDVMELAPAVTDAAAVTASYDTPTMQAPECVACHQIIDPLAGLFQQVDTEGDFAPWTPWHTDMFPPGFEGETIPTSELWRSYQWLGERIAADPRFAVAMTEHAWYILTQDKVVTAPLDTADPLYQARLRAYSAQRELIHDAADVFTNSNFDFKAMFAHLVMSEAYRAETWLGGTMSDERAAELEPLGIDALLTPEQLHRKMELLFGADIRAAKTWLNPPDLLYGGLNFVDVTERIQDPNAVMGAKMRRWAGEVSCHVVSKELMDGPQLPHLLFPDIDADTTDETAIRDVLSHLHQLILNRLDDPDSPEVDRSYQLWSTLRAEGLQRISFGDESYLLMWNCRTLTGDRQDDDYVIRAWQGVLTYLLRRPEFLSQ